MASVTHQGQGSSLTFPLRPVSWSKGLESNQFSKRVQMGGRTIKLISLRSNNSLRIGAKGKAFKVLSFKGVHGKNDEQSGGGRASGSTSFKKSAKISYIPDDNESSTLIESPDLTCDDEKIQGSRAIQRLFRNWLTLLRSPLPVQPVDQTLDEPSTPQIPVTQENLTTPIKKRAEFARAFWGYVRAIDSRVMIPLTIFIPLYIGVNVIYGAEVSKELSPMWIIGPLFVALQVQSVRWVCQLYVFACKQTIVVAKKLKTLCLDIVSGKYTLETVFDFKLDSESVKGYWNMWLEQRNLDLMDAWPTYRKTYITLMYNRSDSA